MATSPAANVCFNLQERLLPHLRAHAARRLASRGLRQSRIAEHLGVSQAMVSKYLRRLPAPPGGIAADRLQSVVDEAVASVLDEERRGRLPPWCPLCPQLWGRPAHAAGLVDECLRGDAPASGDEGQAVLENVRAAAQRLRHPPFARLAPAVGVNIAMATRTAQDARGVASIPGRLAQVRGELRPVGDPEFGASHHLSTLLLNARRSIPGIRAIACIKDAPEVRTATRAAKLRSVVLARARGELRLSRLPRDADVLVDPGDFGIEPITYVLGESALDVVDKADRLLRNLPLRRKNP